MKTAETRADLNIRTCHLNSQMTVIMKQFQILKNWRVSFFSVGTFTKGSSADFLQKLKYKIIGS
jgi:hypothetical protein